MFQVHCQPLLTLFKVTIVIMWTLLHTGLLSVQALEEGGWDWELTEGHFPSLSCASCPDNLMGMGLSLGRGGSLAVCQHWKNTDGEQRGKQDREGRSLMAGSQRSILCFCFWPLCASPGWQGRHGKAQTSHRAAQWAQNRKHETERHRYSFNRQHQGSNDSFMWLNSQRLEPRVPTDLGSNPPRFLYPVSTLPSLQPPLLLAGYLKQLELSYVS